MNKIEEFLVDLLQGKITINDNVVEVRRTFLPSAILPCITLDIASIRTDYTYRTLSDGEAQIAVRECEIQINTWCNNESDRESINTQIRECFTKASNHDYHYCTQYNDGQCTTLSETCRATTVVNRRSVKKQCPEPEEYEYESLFCKHGVIDNTCILEPPFYMDEVQQKPPILRSIHRFTAWYEEQLWKEGRDWDDGTITDITIC